MSFINVRLDELSADEYADLCYAIECELQRVRRSRLVTLTQLA